ncbi:phage head-tail connector protein [Oceanobacillus indicireducens]|uniref:Phage head-tail adapter protein n=1 Tax=Oceanobacillus indicireducens TaxID=1004261 RepID=A0A917Y348_9BACI|nr:phage head-tail connector protein [Oceanobacillus indicireducens]GGN64295.1 phage head-tail adapter protein [Oceanobacillus indicireducens]
MPDIKKNIKIVLDIQDDMQDPVLDVLIKNVRSLLLGKLRKVNKSIETIPEELEYIIEEVTLRRFNRIGSEGFKSESVEGHRIDFYDLDKELDPYMDIIEDYAEDEDDTGSKRGKVLFI